MTTFTLWEGERHRLVTQRFDASNIVTCTFQITCPGNSSGMALRVTKSKGSDLTASVNIPLSAAPISTVNSESGLIATFARPSVEITTFGSSGSVAVVASCISTQRAKVPQNADSIN